MPSFQSIVLTDATSPTPVNHSLVPVSNDSGVAIVAESNVSQIGELRLEIVPRQRRGAGRKFLVDMKLVKPTVVTETINGVAVSKVDRVNLFTGTFSCAENSTEQERKDLIAMVASAMASSKPLLYDTVVKVQGIFG